MGGKEHALGYLEPHQGLRFSPKAQLPAATGAWEEKGSAGGLRSGEVPASLPDSRGQQRGPCDGSNPEGHPLASHGCWHAWRLGSNMKEKEKPDQL